MHGTRIVRSVHGRQGHTAGRLLSAAVVVCTGCSMSSTAGTIDRAQDSAAVSTVVATVNGVDISAEQLTRLVDAGQHGAPTSRGHSAQAELLERVITRELLAQEATARGYDEAAAIRRVRRHAAASRLIALIKPAARASAGQPASDKPPLAKQPQATRDHLADYVAGLTNSDTVVVDAAALDDCWEAITHAGVLKPGASSDGTPWAVTLGLSAAHARLPVARVADSVLTAVDYLEAYRRMHPAMRALHNKRAKRHAYLRQMTERLALAHEALARGLGDDPEVRAAVQDALRLELTRDVAQEATRHPPTDSELRAYYDSHPEQSSLPEQVQLDQLVFAESSAATDALRRLGEQPSHAWFRGSLRPASAQGATLPFVGRDGQQQPSDPRVPASLIAAAFTLREVGQVYPAAIETDGQYYLLRFAARRAAFSRSFELSRAIVTKAVKVEQRTRAIDRLVAKLRQSARVSIDDAELAGVWRRRGAP